MQSLSHRRQFACLTCPSPCELKNAREISDATCPLNRWPLHEPRERGGVDLIKTPPRIPVTISTDKSLIEQVGPHLWADLHSTAKAGNLTPEWLEEFTKRIPCGICRSHWIELLKTHPPRYDDQYAWSVEVHNVVNVRLGKPVWTIDTGQ